MDRKLTSNLSQNISKISDELLDLLNNLDFQIGYTEGTYNTPVTYFNKVELANGIKNYPFEKVRFVKSADTFNGKLFNCIIKNNLSIFDSIKKIDLSYITIHDLFGSKSGQFLLNCKLGNSIVNDISNTRFKKIFTEGARQIGKKYDKFSNENLTLQYISEIQDINEALSGNYFAEYKILEELINSLEGKNPFSVLWSEKETNHSDTKLNIILVFDRIQNKLMRLKSLLEFKTFNRYLKYLYLNSNINIPSPPSQKSSRANYDKLVDELIDLPSIQIQILLSSQKDPNASMYFIEDEVFTDYNDDDIVMIKKAFSTFDNCNQKEIVKIQETIPIDPSQYNILANPFFSTISNLQLIHKFIHYKLYYIATNFEISIKRYIEDNTHDLIFSNHQEVIVSLIDKYKSILETPDLKILISPILKLPKKISDLFLEGLIAILENKLKAIATSTLEVSKTPIKLIYKLKIYWDEKKLGMSLKQVLKGLYIPIEDKGPFITEKDVDLFIDRFFVFEDKEELIEPEYLDIETNGYKVKEIKGFFNDLRGKYFPELPMEQFVQIYLLAFSNRFQNRQITEQNIKNHRKNSRAVKNNSLRVG